MRGIPLSEAVGMDMGYGPGMIFPPSWTTDEPPYPEDPSEDPMDDDEDTDCSYDPEAGW